MARYCAACRVDVGECPDCGTFWYRRWGKRFGMRRVGPGGGRCHWTDSAEQLPQFVRPVEAVGA